MDSDSSLKLNLHELEDQPPWPKTKLRFFIYSVIIVSALTSAFTIWKSHLKNPSTAIQVACSKTYDHHLCFESLSALHKNTSIPSKSITPSNIFTLSLEATINELSDQIIPTIKITLVSETDRWRIRPLKKCDNLLNDSRTFLNMSLTIMRVDNPDDRIFRDANFTSYLEKKITDARDNIAACRSELFYRPENEVLYMKMKEAWLYADSSLRILYYRDEIHEELNPTIASLWNSLVVRESFQMVLSCLPLVFLVFLVVMILKT